MAPPSNARCEKFCRLAKAQRREFAVHPQFYFAQPLKVWNIPAATASDRPIGLGKQRYAAKTDVILASHRGD
jgi:hypothetical protein